MTDTNTHTVGSIFYSDVVMLDPANHSHLGVDPEIWANLTQGMQTCVLAMNEIEHASRDFPVVFMDGDDAFPMAILSLNQDHNPFLQDGKWAPTTYVPMAIRQYPFVFSNQVSGEGARALMVDRAALVPVGSGAVRLFEGEAPTPMMEGTTKVAQGFQAAIFETKPFFRLLKETGLLSKRRLTLPIKGKPDMDIGAAVVVDETKLAGLQDEVIVEFQRSGVLRKIHAHQISLKNLNVVNDLN